MVVSIYFDINQCLISCYVKVGDDGIKIINLAQFFHSQVCSKVKCTNLFIIQTQTNYVEKLSKLGRNKSN